MNRYTVIAIYRDNEQPFAQAFRTRDPERAAECAQSLIARRFRVPVEDEPLVIAAVVAGDVEILV